MVHSCQHCGASYYAKPSHANRTKYCSRHCKSSHVAQATAARRGDMQRDRGEGRSYRKRGGRHEHRVVAEHMLGRRLTRGEIVHHRDGNIRNNDPDNLQVMTQAEHMRAHGLGIPGVRPAWQLRSAT